MNIAKAKIANALTSAAQDHVVAVAHDVYDEAYGDYQDNINDRVKDRTYAVGVGMGYVILRKDKTFAEQVTKANTIYEIRYDFNLGGKEVTIPEGCILQFDGGALENGKIKGQQTLIQAPKTTIFNNVEVTGTWKSCTIYAAWWEHTQETDDIIARSISAMCSEGGVYHVEFEAGKEYKYVYDGTDANLSGRGNTSPTYLLQKCCVDIDMNGSTHRIIPSNTCKYIMFQFAHCEKANICNGTLIGDRLEHDYETIDSSHEFGHGIVINGKNVIIDNIVIHDMIGDGIYVGDKTYYGEAGTEEDLQRSRVASCEIKNSEIHHCRRQGISLCETPIDAVVRVSNCNIHDIGTSDGVEGAAPMSGIDIEPESSRARQGGTYVLENSIIKDCYYSAIVAAHLDTKAKKLIVKDSEITGPVNTSIVENFIVDNCKIFIEKMTQEGLATVFGEALVTNSVVEVKQPFSVYSKHSEWRNTRIQGFGAESTLFPFGGEGKSSKFYNCEINNFLGINTGGAYPNTPNVGGLTGPNETAKNHHHFYNCKIKDCTTLYKVGSGIFSNCELSNVGFLGVAYCKVDSCTINNCWHIGGVYHDPMAMTFEKCTINEDFSGDKSKWSILLPGNNTDRQKLINCQLNIVDKEGLVTANHTKVAAYLSRLVFDVDPSMTLANVEAYNSVIQGNRADFNGTGENNSYIQIPQTAE